MGCLFYSILLICLISYNIHIRTEKYKNKKEYLENKKRKERVGRLYRKVSILNSITNDMLYIVTQDVLKKLRNHGYDSNITKPLIPLLNHEFSEKNFQKELDKLGFDKNQREMIMTTSAEFTIGSFVRVINLILIVISIIYGFK